MKNIIDNINYNAYLYQQSILDRFEQISAPLFHLGIKSFIYFKTFENGRYLNLINNLEYSKNYFLNVKDNGTFFSEQINKVQENKLHYCSLGDIKNFDKKKDPILYLLHDFNMWNSFAIYKKNHISIECYLFQMTREDTEFSQFYLDKLHLLEHFCDYFNDRAKDIIDCSDQQKLAYFNQQFNFRDGPKEDFQAQRIKQFLQETRIKDLKMGEKSLFSSREEMEGLRQLTLGADIQEIAKDLEISPLFIQASLQNLKNLNKNESNTALSSLQASLSPRQQECFFYLIRGQTAKQIAQKLGCSYRTIETHIDHIKSKFKCTTKGQLIELAFQDGFVDSVLNEVSKNTHLHKKLNVELL